MFQCAPTHSAARELPGGMTPHRLFHSKTRRGITPDLGAAVLVVGEAFYCGVTLLTLLTQVKLASPAPSKPQQCMRPAHVKPTVKPPPAETMANASPSGRRGTLLH